MISNAPTKGDMGCVWPKGRQAANGDDKGKWLQNTGVCTISNEIVWKKCTNIETGAPMWNECPREGINFWENWWRVGGPIGEFLYEVGEMKGDLQMGKLIVDEMEGSWYYGGAVKKIEPWRDNLGVRVGKLAKWGEGVCGWITTWWKTIGTPIPKGF